MSISKISIRPVAPLGKLVLVSWTMTREVLIHDLQKDDGRRPMWNQTRVRDGDSGHVAAATAPEIRSRTWQHRGTRIVSRQQKPLP